MITRIPGQTVSIPSQTQPVILIHTPGVEIPRGILSGPSLFGHQVTVFDAVSGKRPRQLMAKVESAWFQPGLAPDAGGVLVDFRILVDGAGGTERYLGRARTDRYGIARMPFPPDLDLQPGHYGISVCDANNPEKPSLGRLMITGNRPVLLVPVDGAVLDSPFTLGRALSVNLFQKSYTPSPQAKGALEALSPHYDLIYVAATRDEGTLPQLRKDLFERGGLPAGAVITNDHGIRLKLQARAVSPRRELEFWDDVIARLRGLEKVGVVGGICLDDPESFLHPAEEAMRRHGLEPQFLPRSSRRWFRANIPEEVQKAWADIQDHFLRRHERLAKEAANLHKTTFHTNPEIRFQTEMMLVTGAETCFGNVVLYRHGPQAFHAVMKLFRNAVEARGEIFSFGPDRVGRAFAEGFKGVVRRGGRASLIPDAFGSVEPLPGMNPFLNELRRSGVEVTPFYLPLAEPLDLVNSAFYRDHRKTLILKIREPDGRIRVVAVLGGRNWKEPFWTYRYDNTIIVEGQVVRSIYDHLRKVSRMVSAPPLPEPDEFFKDVPSPGENHTPGDIPIRYLAQYPKEDQNIHRAFLTMLQNPDSRQFIMESSFPLTTDIMREMIEEKDKHPNKEIIWVMGNSGHESDGPFETLKYAQALILKQHGIRVMIRTPLNYKKLSPMHVKTFTDGFHLFVGTWNPDEQSAKDLEAGVVLSPNPEDETASGKLRRMIAEGIGRDAENGIDIEEWLCQILPNASSGLQNLLRQLALSLAPKAQEMLNYFM